MKNLNLKVIGLISALTLITVACNDNTKKLDRVDAATDLGNSTEYAYVRNNNLMFCARSTHDTTLELCTSFGKIIEHTDTSMMTKTAYVAIESSTLRLYGVKNGDIDKGSRDTVDAKVTKVTLK